MLPKTRIESKLSAEITRALAKLEKLDPKSEDYKTTLEQVTKLHEMKTKEGLKLPSLDTMLIVAANIFGVILLTRFEKENVIPSKSAFNFMLKPR